MRCDKLARAFKDKTLDPKLETELRDLRTRFEEKTGKAKKNTAIDSSTNAENKALAEQQRSNNTIKWAEKTTEAEKRAAKAAEEELENQRGRVIKAIKAEKEAREEGIRIQEQIDEIRYQRREGKNNGGGAQDEIDEDEVDAKIVQEHINKIYDECGEEEQGQAASLCQDAIQSALRSKRQR